MKTDQLNRWLSLGANLGVLVGLVFVGLELRQTTSAVLGATYQARAAEVIDWGKWVADSDWLIDAMLQAQEVGFSSLSPEQKLRSRNAGLAAFSRIDAVHYQFELGLLPDEYYNSRFPYEMATWVPRWREFGLLDHPALLAARSSFAAEIEKYTALELRPIVAD